MRDAAPPLDVDAAPVAWRESGAGDLLLFLHGLGQSRTGFDRQLADFAPRARCVAWDMPGYGRSAPGPSPLTFADCADAVAGLLDALGCDRCRLAGLSLGGQVALHTALAHPDRVEALVLCDTSPAFGLDGTDPAAWIQRRLQPLAGLTPAAIAEPVLRSVMAPGASDAIVAEAAASMARVDAAGFTAAVRMLPGHDVRARLGEIRCPTLVVCGALDRETPPAYAAALAEAIPGARLALVPAAGHMVPAEAPEAFAGLVGAFLDELEAMS